MTKQTASTCILSDSDCGGIVHIANIKGGVGKSTVAVNLAAALARRSPTLLIDLDVQGSSTHSFGRLPSLCGTSSWELFIRRFKASCGNTDNAVNNNSDHSGSYPEKHTLQRFFPSALFQPPPLNTLAHHVAPGLDLIPANADLFKPVHFYHLYFLMANLATCRKQYTYVILDTPSIWNHLTRMLYCASDLNLIPVTLNALSTKSLKDYLLCVKKLAARRSQVRVRIIKNEVFGKESSKLKGKTRTMHENRKFLQSLCEQVEIRNQSGTAFLPQSMMFDLEIPESAAVRIAQDEGKTVRELHRYSPVAKAFDELAQRVEYVLNTNGTAKTTPSFSHRGFSATLPVRAALTACAILIFGLNPPISHESSPRPIAPQQLVSSTSRELHHTFSPGESIYRIAKYAICRFRACVPSHHEVNTYVQETVAIHNRTRIADEQVIEDAAEIDAGMTICFYPPDGIHNPREQQLLPVYQFFTAMTSDPYAYVTGDWCERGSGGDEPHFGIDVAGKAGEKVFSPLAGTVYLKNSSSFGRTVGIVADGMVIFFSHLDKRFFRSGDTIQRGTAVGTIGMTGRTSGPHVHIGYGIADMSSRGIRFGGRNYRLTDPKLFFYRESFLQQQQTRRRK